MIFVKAVISIENLGVKRQMTSTNEEEIRALADAKADQKIGKQEFLNQIFGEVGTFIKGMISFA